MNCGVTSITTRNNQATGVLLETGEFIQAEKIISTCGIRETEELLNLNAIEDETIRTGKFSIIESIRGFDGHPRDFGWDETVIFFNKSNQFNYDCPKSLVDLESGVICMPDNYGNPTSGKESKIRVTHPANFSEWNKLPEPEYRAKKKKWEETILKQAMNFLPNGQNQLSATYRKNTSYRYLYSNDYQKVY